MVLDFIIALAFSSQLALLHNITGALPNIIIALYREGGKKAHFAVTYCITKALVLIFGVAVAPSIYP